MTHRLPELAGKRVRLRTLEADDAEALLESWGDPAAMAYMARPPLADRRAALAFIAGMHEGARRGELFQWGVFLDDVLTGTVTLAAIDREHHRGEIGFILAPRWQGRGLMRDALERLLAHAFGDLGLRRIEADVDPDNRRSLALLERFGFRREGRMKARYWIDGEPRDGLLLALLKPAGTSRL